MVSRKHISVQAPSNIAFVKYWGKTGRQYPINPSVSMTLKKCYTGCQISYCEGVDALSVDEFLFSGAKNEKFRKRIETYLHDIAQEMPMLNNLSLAIETENTFPHSAGIASSASAFAAIAYGLVHIEQELGIEAEQTIEQRASMLARLGSGSAGRSIAGPYTIWGDFTPEQSHNDFATEIKGIHPEFHQVKDAILLIDRQEKKVSSSAGHKLMENHPYRQARIEQAQDHTVRIIQAMRSGDWDCFGKILENDALALHSLMMTSDPSFILLAPNSLAVIARIRDFRETQNVPVYFTIDAGPNIHLIYPKSHEIQVEKFIEEELVSFCEDRKYIIDECGSGARILHA